MPCGMRALGARQRGARQRFVNREAETIAASQDLEVLPEVFPVGATPPGCRIPAWPRRISFHALPAVVTFRDGAEDPCGSDSCVRYGKSKTAN